MSAVCSTCNDTHLMPYGEDRVMCTRCPVPCQECRAGGTGAFCGKTPCECQCHDPRRVRESLDAHAAGYAAAVADIRQLVLAAANRQSGEMFRAKGAVLRRIYGTVSESLFGLLEAIAAGAHVGAAKKGAT